MTNRIYNFSAGPAVLPEEVLLEAQEFLFSLPGVGMSILEISHRSKAFDKIILEAEQQLRSLLNISDNYAVLFLQGGASLQFSMVPLNLMTNKKADYIITGSWSKKALKEAKRVGAINIAATAEAENFKRIPMQNELKLDPSADYVHFTSNNTIYGTEWQTEPQTGDVPLVCDASSDILSKKIDVNKYGLIYAGAQKNMGPSGVTLVVIRKDLAERASDELHTMLNYKIHIENKSLYNTPNTFGIYIINLVAKWLNKNGGLDAMYKVNKQKADVLYKCIDESNGFYKGHAEKDSRSLMNITFRMPSEELEKKLIADAAAAGFDGLKGHRSVGGLRASIYNAFPFKGVQELAEFMKDFKAKHADENVARQNKIIKMKYPALLPFFFVLLFSSCSKDEESKMDAFSPEAFAYDLGNGWEVNASTFVKGFKQEKEGEIYTALLSYDLDLVTPKGDTIKSLISRIEDKKNNEEMIDTQLEAQFELDSTYAPGKYSVVFRIKDGLTNRTARSAAGFEITKE